MSGNPKSGGHLTYSSALQRKSLLSELTKRYQSNILLYGCAVNGLSMGEMGFKWCCRFVVNICNAHEQLVKQLCTDGFREMKQFLTAPNFERLKSMFGS